MPSGTGSSDEADLRSVGGPGGDAGHVGDDEATPTKEVIIVNGQTDEVHDGHEPVIIISRSAAKWIGLGLLIVVLLVAFQSWKSRGDSLTIQELKTTVGDQAKSLKSLDKLQQRQAAFNDLIRRLILAQQRGDQKELAAVIRDLERLAKEDAPSSPPGSSPSQSGSQGPRGEQGPQGSPGSSGQPGGNTTSTTRRSSPSSTTTTSTRPPLVTLPTLPRIN